MFNDNENLSSPNDIVKAFANHFNSVYISHNDTNPPNDSIGTETLNISINYLIFNGVNRTNYICFKENKK